MCNLEEPRAASGPALCDAAKELIVRGILEGEPNVQIRAALKKNKHHHELSGQTFCTYRKMPIVLEARVQSLVNIRDVGVVSLARRIEALDGVAQDLSKAFKQTRDYVEKATLARAFVLVCREISRLVDAVDIGDANAIPNASEEKQDAPQEITISQVLRLMRVMSQQKRRLASAQKLVPQGELAPVTEAAEL